MPLIVGTLAVTVRVRAAVTVTAQAPRPVSRVRALAAIPALFRAAAPRAGRQARTSDHTATGLTTGAGVAKLAGCWLGSRLADFDLIAASLMPCSAFKIRLLRWSARNPRAPVPISWRCSSVG